MDRKTIAFAVICPVLFGCVSSDRTEETVEQPMFSREIGYAQTAPLFPTEKPDSLVTGVLWRGTQPLTVHRVMETESVLQGDTIALGADPYLEVEVERFNMELEFALATGDTTAADSIQAILADSSRYIPITTEFSGDMLLLVFPGESLEPGDTLAVITGAPPDSTYMILPGPGHIRWPAELPDQFTHGINGLICAGVWPGDSTHLPGTWSIGPGFIRESGLRTFVITADGDTVDVTVMGVHQGIRTVYSTVDLDSIPLSSWD